MILVWGPLWGPLQLSPVGDYHSKKGGRPEGALVEELRDLAAFAS